MLRASAAATDTPLDLRGVVDETVDLRIPGGGELRSFADVVVDRRAGALTGARAAVDEVVGAGASAVAAGIVANFQMMNRLLDATGVPVPPQRAAGTRAGRGPQLTRRRCAS